MPPLCLDISEFKQLAMVDAPELSAVRRHLHAHPELSFQETKTSAYLATKLRNLGYQVRHPVAGTGLLAEIGDGPCVGIRADMDALPINEANKTDYCSGQPGIMHACGHDAHVACAYGAAKILAHINKERRLPGKIRIIFQPAEETVNEEGLSGASLMLREEALANLSCLFSLHVFPELPAGHIALTSGALLAACDSIRIKIIGKGAHGAFPENGTDAITLAAHLIQTIQTIVSRRKSALEPAVLTLGGMRSNTFRENILAEEVEMIGTLRYFSREQRDILVEELERCCNTLPALGGRYELQVLKETPALINHERTTGIVRQAAEKIVGLAGIHQAGKHLGSDDFAFYTSHVPACYFVLGVAIEGSPRELHSADFDIDERALPIGAAVLAGSAMLALAEN